MNWADWVVRAMGAIGLPGVVGYWAVDRRKTRAASKLAERTLPADVAKADTGALEAQVIALNHAFTLERDSYVRHVAALTSELADVRGELAAVRTICDKMRSRLGVIDPGWEAEEDARGA